MSNSLLKRTLVVSALVAVAGATAVAPAQAGGRHYEPDNIAHHGASAEAPENTLAAVDLALDQDADFVEVEVQRTSDGHVIAVQDLGLARTTNVEEVFPDRAPWRVNSFTLAEIKQLDAGSWFGAGFAGERIPTLGEVIDEVGYRNGLVVEIVSPARYPGIEQDIVDVLASRPYYLLRAVSLDNLVVQSADVPSASTFHGLAPFVTVGVVYNFRPTDAEIAVVAEWADRVDFLFSRADEALVDVVHDLDLDLTVHTLNTEELVEQYDALGVDAIVTDQPALVDSVLD